MLTEYEIRHGANHRLEKFHVVSNYAIPFCLSSGLPGVTQLFESPVIMETSFFF